MFRATRRRASRCQEALREYRLIGDRIDENDSFGRLPIGCTRLVPCGSNEWPKEFESDQREVVGGFVVMQWGLDGYDRWPREGRGKKLEIRQEAVENGNRRIELWWWWWWVVVSGQLADVAQVVDSG